MKKFLYSLAVLAAAACVAGCNKEADVKTADGPAAEVSFTVDFAGLQTKAWADGNTVDELLAGVYNAETGEYYDKVSTGATGIQPIAVTGGKATFKATLVKGQSYNIVFWAQKSGTGYYDVDFAAKKLTVDYKGVANDETRDAFYTVYPTGVITGAVQETVTLKRPFAQINVLTTDEDVAAAAKLNVAFSRSAMKIAKVNDTMDLLTGETSGEVDVEYTANANTEATILQGYTYVAMNYILAAADKANKDLSFDVELSGTSTVDNTVEVPNVPVRRNWRTNIVGNVFTADAVYTVVVDPIFDGSETLPLDGEVEETVLTFAEELDDEISVEVGKTVNFAATASSDAVVKYATSDKAVGTITDEGLFTAVAEGTATVTVSADAVPATKAADPSKNYTSVEKTFTVTVTPKGEEPETEDYVKVTSTADLTAGEYLIVYEDGSLAFNGGLEKLDAGQNGIAVTISENKIASDETTDAASFTIASIEGGYSIKSASGLYIGNDNAKNALTASETALVNTISIDNDGNAVITGKGGYVLRYNSASGTSNERFRYYASGKQQPVALYKKAASSDEPAGKTEVTLKADDIQIEVGETAEIKYSVEPADAAVTIALAEGADAYIELVDGTSVKGLKATAQDGAKVVLTVAETETLKGATLEVAVTVTETVVETVATPTFNPAAGEVAKGTQVTISTETEGAAIYYRIDNEAEALYEAPVEITEDVTITAIAKKDGMNDSDPATAAYTVKADTPVDNHGKVADDPFTVAEAIAFINSLDGTDPTTDSYYIKGVVSKVIAFNSKYYSINYNIADDVSASSELYVYSGKGLNGANFTAQGDLTVGDEVVVCGKLQNYSGNTPEVYMSNMLVYRKAAATISVAADPVSLTVNGTFDLAVNTNGGAVTYASSNESIATVSAGIVKGVAVGSAVITIHVDATDEYAAASRAVVVDVTSAGSKTVWVKTALGDLKSGDIFVLVGTNANGSYALANNGGTSSAPSAKAVDLDGDYLAAAPGSEIQFTAEVADGGITLMASATTWLYCIANNNGLRVGTGDDKVFSLQNDGYLKNVGQSRYVGIYNSQDWRSYTTVNNNIKDQTFAAYVKTTVTE